MENSDSRAHELPPEPTANAFSAQTKEVRVEIRTNTERIEGFIKIPTEAQNYCKRLSDILWYADRGGTGILTVGNAFVYDLRTSKLVTRQNLLGISKSKIVYFWLLPQEEKEPSLVLEISEQA